MITWNFEIKLISDTLIGSGQSYGSLIDSDIVFDEDGIPYIPAKRIKGCLRDSFEEIYSLFNKVNPNDKIFKYIDLNLTFGQRMLQDIEFRGEEGLVFFSNLYIEEYQSIQENLHSIFHEEKEYAKYFFPESILDSFTILRKTTSIDSTTGSSKTGSLRMVRALKKGITFCGTIELPDNNKIKNTLALAIQNFHSMGTSRNRGMGNIKALLKDEKENDATRLIVKKLEILCKK